MLMFTAKTQRLPQRAQRKVRLDYDLCVLRVISLRPLRLNIAGMIVINRLFSVSSAL
jgi:hypothetical protein